MIDISKVWAQLDAEAKDIKGLSRAGAFVKDYVVETLKVFCEQSEEFARAIEAKKGKLKECVEATVKGCSTALSDNEVYKRAAQFYFPGSVVEFKMILRMSEYDVENPVEGGAISLDLDELIDI